MSKNSKKTPKAPVSEDAAKENGGSKAEEAKKKKLRRIALAVAIVAALAAIFVILHSIVKKVPGFYTVDPDPDKSCPRYAQGVTFTYYFDGSSDEIRNAQMELKAAYGSALLRIYKLLDAQETYDGFMNVAYINAHRGEDIELDPDLYGILIDAAKHTGEGGFNLFGGALYTEWQSIRVSDDRESFDPVVNEEERERIAAIAAACANEANFELRIVDPIKHIVNFTVSPEYERFESEYELTQNTIDLGGLRYAYMLDHLRTVLLRAGYDKGYFVAPDGLSMALAGFGEGQYAMFALNGETPRECCAAPMLAGSACAVYRAFDYPDANEYYRVSADGRTVLRHPHYNAETGEVFDELTSVMVLDSGGSLVNACLAAGRLFSFGSLSEAEKAAKTLASEGLMVAYIPREQPGTVCVDRIHSALIEPLNGFELNIVEF